jgi:hypothetical protein
VRDPRFGEDESLARVGNRLGRQRVDVEPAERGVLVRFQNGGRALRPNRALDPIPMATADPPFVPAAPDRAGSGYILWP